MCGDRACQGFAGRSARPSARYPSRDLDEASAVRRARRPSQSPGPAVFCCGRAGLCLGDAGRGAVGREGDGAVDHVAGQVGDAHLVAAGVGAQPLEGGAGIDAVVGGEVALGLVDDAAGGVGLLQLHTHGAVVVQAGLLEQGDGR
ncbi:hypothetical protein GCM10010129_82900 [Streptomyces fumigatiscleroticus]|nr:hypothetical protein GCM10010129_82900 [Streptomyces fumigatiscleroticus]